MTPVGGVERAECYWEDGGQTAGGQTAWKRAVAGRVLGSSGRVLDVACGRGDSSLRGWIGLEGDGRAAAASRGAGVVPIVADAEEGWPFRGASFDAVVLFDVLEHMPSPHWLLREAGRVLTPRGDLLVALPNAAHLANRLLAARGSTADFTDAAHLRGAPTSDHLHRFSAASGSRLLADVGFEVIDRWQWLPDRFHEGRWRALSPVASALTRVRAAERWPGLLAYEFLYRARRR